MYGEVSIGEAILNLKPNFSIIAGFGVGSRLRNYSENVLNDEPYIFRNICEKLEELGFEFVIFDLSPSFARLEKCVLLAVVMKLLHLWILNISVLME